MLSFCTNKSIFVTVNLINTATRYFLYSVTVIDINKHVIDFFVYPET